MHPASSVIGFTVSSGAGYGMLAILGVLGSLGLLHGDWVVGLIAMFIAIGLVTGGLLSSTFHLGHPERAWRAFSQWRSSWLSREGVAAVVTYAPAGLFGWLWIIDGNLSTPLAHWTGGILAAMSLVTIFCTAMIYRSLKPVPAWSNGWTTPVYLILGLGSGLVALVAIFALTGEGGMARGLAVVASAALGAGGAIKWIYWRELATETTAGGFQMPSRESATGLTLGGRVRPLENPHSSDNYLMKEMGFRVGRKHAAKLRRIALFAGFVAPFALSVGIAVLPAGGIQIGLAILAALFMAAGLVAERWLFFAEARHVMTLYYRDIGVEKTA